MSSALAVTEKPAPPPGELRHRALSVGRDMFKYVWENSVFSGSTARSLPLKSAGVPFM